MPQIEIESILNRLLEFKKIGNDMPRTKYTLNLSFEPSPSRYSISQIRSFIEQGKKDLAYLNQIMDTNDSLYIQISSAIVSLSLSALCEILNCFQGNSELQYGLPYILKQSLFPEMIDKAIPIVDSIQNLPMDDATSAFYNSQKQTLKLLQKQYNPEPITKKGACYIATMVYGDYNHPKVVILREFRDLYLMKRRWGQKFVNLYYRYSPKLVERLRDYVWVNIVIRFILDKFIFILKNKR
ncbi:MAG: hypothetical protein K2K27_09035 [Muribaculaceae bacterium]|nr:hypothetical protein [Muribaculaceae bacterium]